jgi:hypothetical protein
MGVWYNTLTRFPNPGFIEVPSAAKDGKETNLWLACPLCNGKKSNKTEVINPESGELFPLFNPRRQVWSEHFAWTDDGMHIVDKTPLGRATVMALHLSDDPDAVLVRSYWVMAGWHPPHD